MEQDKITALIPADGSASFSGQHGICEVNRVISELEKWCSLKSDGTYWKRNSYGPRYVELQRFISPDGETIESDDPLRIPFSRIIAHDNSASTKLKASTKSDAITTAINAYLVECESNNKTPDLDECWRFASEQAEIEKHFSGDLLYPIYSGKKVKPITRKQFSERLNKRLEKR
jgi:hypothetical protein